MELTNIYSEIMDGVYYGHLRQYYADTAKLIKKVSKGSELIFSDKVRGNLELDNAALNKPANQTLEFNQDNSGGTSREQQARDVEERSQILQQLDGTPIVVAIAQSKKLQYPFEEVFRSQNKLIVDAVCKEFVFVLEFFDLIN